MKKSFFLSFLFSASLLSIMSCNEPQTAETSSSETKEVKVKKEVLAENKAEVKMEVEGMVCAMGCAKFIQDEVATLDGIVLSEVNFEEGSAKFEFDKTELSAKDIEKYINEIHDGQYKAKIASNEVIDTDLEDEAGEDDESLGSVKERINDVSLPQLFTYFLKRFR